MISTGRSQNIKSQKQTCPFLIAREPVEADNCGKALYYNGKTINEVIEDIECRVIEDTHEPPTEQTKGGSRTMPEPPMVSLAARGESCAQSDSREQ